MSKVEFAICQKMDHTVNKRMSDTWRQTTTPDNKSEAVCSKTLATRGNVRALDAHYYTKLRHGQKGRHGRENSDYKYGKQSRHSPVIKTIVQNLNLDCVKPQRAGVIIYTIINGSTYFGLGLDSKTHDLTDFGGGVIYKTDGDVIKGALRELEEETLEIFDPISPQDIRQCPVIYDDNNLIVFVHMNVDPDTTCFAFNEKYKQVINACPPSIPTGKRRKRYEPEVCGITWLSWEDFQRSIKEKGIMFSRVQRFLNRAEDFSYLL